MIPRVGRVSGSIPSWTRTFSSSAAVWPGLVATAELAAAGRSVIVIDSEPLQSLGGQAYWSIGGLFLVNTPEQRRLRIRDSTELARADWLGSAAFDRSEDYWPRRWAEAFVDFAAGEEQRWLRDLGVRWFPVVQWAERGGYPRPDTATRCRASTSSGAPGRLWSNRSPRRC